MSKLLENHTIGNYIFEVYDDKPSIDFIEVNQVHGNIAIHADDISESSQADAITTTDETLAIKTADCLPIAIVGEHGAALIHAGWRGIENKIITNPLISELNPQFAYIGPHIKETNFEVSEDFKNNFPYSPNFSRRDGKMFFDMQQELIEQLLSTYSLISIETSNTCTFENSEYNSYRRNKTTKRNYNILKRV